jgi:hypothetical protein
LNDSTSLFYFNVGTNEKNFIAKRGKKKKNTTQRSTEEKSHTQPKAMNQLEAFTKF